SGWDEFKKRMAKKQEILAKISELSPKSAYGHFAKGTQLAAANKSKESILEFDLAIKATPAMWQATYERGMAHSRLQDYAASLADLDRTIQLNPRFTGAYYSRSQAREAFGDKQGAVADLTVIIER